jgi:tetratricopeptide (TPR) repeat protein
MTITRTASAIAIVLALSSVVGSEVRASDDSLARAKDLYASAAYDEALALLNQFNDSSPSEAVEVDQYRAFCLLALGRRDDAGKVIQQIVEADPSFQPSETQASPRLQEAFRDVRRRVLPSIVRQSYADGKAAFERKEFELAIRRFDNVISLLNDPDIVGRDELKDLRTLSTGFRDLITTSNEPVATPATVAAPIVVNPPSKPESDDSVYGPEDADVVPPVTISQALPAWQRTNHETQAYEATLILVIDQTGRVTSVNMTGTLQPSYSSLLRDAVNQWKFQPATKNGVPVKFRKILAIRLKPWS